MASTPEKHGRYWRTRWRHQDGTWQTFRHVDKHHVGRFLKWLDVVNERNVRQDDERIDAGAYLVAGADEITLAVLARELINDRMTAINRPIKASSVNGYEDRIKRFGDLGDISYDEITSEMVQAHVHGMRTTSRQGTGRPYAANTIRETVSLMKQVGAWARKTNRAATDPFVDVELPRGGEVRQQNFMTVDQYQQLRGFAPNEQFGDMMDLIATATGLRIGEVLGLRVNDLGTDGEYDRLRVDETLTARTGYGPPKNSKTRTIDIDPQTAAVLRKWSGGRTGESPLFLNATGTGPISYNSFSGVWDRMVMHSFKAGVQFSYGVPTTHWLRHTYAAWFLSARDDRGNYVGNIYDLQARLGHSSIQITIDRYGHLDPQARERAFAAVSAIRRPFVAPAASRKVVPLSRIPRGSRLGVAP